MTLVDLEERVGHSAAELISEVDRIANSTEYNGVKLVDGNIQTLTFQVPAGTPSIWMSPLKLGTAK